jgi:hypothetical protein
LSNFLKRDSGALLKKPQGQLLDPSDYNFSTVSIEYLKFLPEADSGNWVEAEYREIRH